MKKSIRYTALLLSVIISISLAACQKPDKNTDSSGMGIGNVTTGSTDVSQTITTGSGTSTQGTATDKTGSQDSTKGSTVSSKDGSSVSSTKPVTNINEKRYEAEAAALKSGFKVTNPANYSGTGSVNVLDTDGAYVKFTVNVLEAGNYDVIAAYAAPANNAWFTLYLNGDTKNYKGVFLPKDKSFKRLCIPNVALKKGNNIIQFYNNKGGAVFDYIVVTKHGQDESYKNNVKVIPMSSELIDPKATPEARAVMKYLASIYGSKILTGQHLSPGAGNPQIALIKQYTGKTPALRGFDMLFQTDGADDKVEIDSAIEAWKKDGALVTFCWHWRARLQYGKQSAYTNDTSFDVSKAVIPGTAEYQIIIKDIADVAAKLKRLQDEGVPVIWRPLHEAAGGWFWWGAKGADSYKKLWDIVYNELTVKHDIHNLIWVWNGQGQDWYVGDKKCDIAGYDIYNGKNPTDYDYSPGYPEYSQLMNFMGGRKMVALTENGPVPDPDMLIGADVNWLWNMVWFGHIGVKMNASTADWTKPEDLKRFYNSEYYITCEELPDWSQYVKKHGK